MYVLSECVFGLNYAAGCRVLQGDSAVEVEYSNMSLTCQMLALRRPFSMSVVEEGEFVFQRWEQM